MKKSMRVFISFCAGVLFLLEVAFPQQITDFNATFSYPCDNSYFNKGDSLFVFCKAGNASLQMRKINPAGWSKDSRLPVIVMFFGGGWVGDCAPEFTWFTKYFISKGFVVLIADYVLGAPIEQKAIPDAKAAIRWVRQNADTLGIDPKKIISFGSSAGGHLAAAVGTVKGFELSGENLTVSSRPNCIISLWPVMDLTKSSSNMTSVDPKLVSPAWALDDTVPPILVMTGSNDPYISGVRQFNTNAASYKFEHQYKEYPNAGHDFGFRFGSDIDKGNAGEDSTIAWSMAFLRQHNMLPGSVTVVTFGEKGNKGRIDPSGAKALACYTLQGKLIGLFNKVQSPSQQVVVVRKGGIGVLFSQKKGVVVVR
jgi:acetyl esterase/lipase